MTWNPNDENEALRASWEQHDSAELDSYMIADVEDPRIHCQSILNRALVADSLWPGEFTSLIDAEQRFGVVMTWISPSELRPISIPIFRYFVAMPSSAVAGPFCVAGEIDQEINDPITNSMIRKNTIPSTTTTNSEEIDSRLGRGTGLESEDWL